MEFLEEILLEWIEMKENIFALIGIISFCILAWSIVSEIFKIGD
jgi:hypothetical protein